HRWRRQGRRDLWPLSRVHGFRWRRQLLQRATADQRGAAAGDFARPPRLHAGPVDGGVRHRPGRHHAGHGHLSEHQQFPDSFARYRLHGVVGAHGRPRLCQNPADSTTSAFHIMKVSVVGTGYVGLVTGACLAEMGNDVLCLDVDPNKIRILEEGGIPIHEPGLDQVVARNVKAGRLSFTTDIARAVAHGTIQFIAVGTPPDEDGSADLQYVLAAARNIGRLMTDHKVIVDKSTVPVGTADKVRAAVADELAKRGEQIAYSVVSNPEFLKEGAAVEDFMRPDRIVIGADDETAVMLMRALYAPFQRNKERLIVMDVRSAELTKYAANAMLATRISFMNELALLAEKMGAD